MPKIGTAEKTKRDTDILAGLPALLMGKDRITMYVGERTLVALRAMFEKHLRAMAKVRELTIARRIAVEEERKIEAALLPEIEALKLAAQGRVGKHDARIRALGFKPDKKPVMSAATKVLANAKRQATRKQRGIVGKKRRRR